MCSEWIDSDCEEQNKGGVSCEADNRGDTGWRQEQCLVDSRRLGPSETQESLAAVQYGRGRKPARAWPVDGDFIRLPSGVPP